MAATTKKKRKREEEEVKVDTPYQSNKKLIIGSRVEVRSVEEGFAGSWHCGTVVACWHLCRVVEYDHYLDDQGLENLKETVHVSPLLEGILLQKSFNYRSIIRPIPPHCKIKTGSLNYGLCVDAFMDDAWWEGVIFDDKHVFLDRLVFFPDFGGQQMMKIDELRLTQDWDEVEECWTVRGNWKFLELIEKFPTIVQSAKQIWYCLSQKEEFGNTIKEWTCNDKSMWVDLVVETVSQYLDISAEVVYRVISEKVGNYSVNDEPKKSMRSRKKYPVSKFLKSSAEEGVSKDGQEEGTQFALPSIFVENLSEEDEDGPISYKRNKVKISDSIRVLSDDLVEESLTNHWSSCDDEIDDDAQEARGIVVDSDEVVVCTCYTANGEDKVRGVGTAPEDTLYGSSSDGDDDLIYKEPSIKSASLRGVGLRKKRIQAPTGSESKGPRWLPLGTDLLPGVKCFPEALRKYLKARGGSNKESDDLRLKCRMHLSYLGWRIEYRKTGLKGVIFCYTPPKGGTPLYSFRRACQEAMSAGLRRQVPSTSICIKGEDCTPPPPYLEPESLYTSPKGGTPLYSIHRKCEKAMSSCLRQQVPLSRIRIHRKDQGSVSPPPYLEHKLLYSNTPESRRTPIIRGKLNVQPNSEFKTLVPRSSKKARQVVVSSSAHHIPRTILSWLIENNVVLPRAKVHYLSAKDDSIIGQGKINQNEIKCNCCQEVFSLYKFGLHVGSCYFPPSAKIYLQDGRSLLDCQKQLQEKSPMIYAQKRDLVYKKNDYICTVCHCGGQLLLCDQCPASFHLNCLGLEDFPDGKWFCPSCGCGICGQQSELDSDSGEPPAEKKILRCDQCNHEYHAGCIRKRRSSKLDHNNLNSNWFCSIRCEKTFASLHKILRKSIPIAKEDLSWTILKHKNDSRHPFAPSDIESVTECQSKLHVALCVMHECFESIKEPYMNRDLIEDVLFSKPSDLNRLDFQGFYTVLLEREDEIISVAAVRIHDEKVAEIPLVCTRAQYRKQGMCRILINVLEEKLRELEVERVVLPAMPQVLRTWTTSFGFSVLSISERLELLRYTFLEFQDTRMCQKILCSLSAAKPTNEVPRVLRGSNANVQQLVGTSTFVDGPAAAKESAQSPPQCVKPITEELRGNRPKLILKFKQEKKNVDMNRDIITPAVIQAERAEWRHVAEQQPVEVGMENVSNFVATARSLDVTTTLQDGKPQDWQNGEPCIAKKCLLDDKPWDYPCTQEGTLKVDSEQNPQNREAGYVENSVVAVYSENQQEKKVFDVKFYTRRKILSLM
ncbi:hypothetical protein MKX01_038880 [Papaver californicum]|nr:hypothetical protein MKX01_038880 [Papaver californicum]